jgi:RNA ligase
MNYQFPIIETIDDILPAIKGRDEFIIADRDDHLIANYLVNFADTFPNPAEVNDPVVARNYAIRRECRGITFDKKSGKIIRRVYHKFFNLNERPETSQNNVDFSQDHVVMTKLDGSMIAPFYSEGQLRFGTKMGITEVAGPAEKFAYASRNYIDFSRNLIADGYTPIFEWTSRKQKIVIDYPEDNLVLTAVRHMITGEYVPY